MYHVGASRNLSIRLKQSQLSYSLYSSYGCLSVVPLNFPKAGEKIIEKRITFIPFILPPKIYLILNTLGPRALLAGSEIVYEYVAVDGDNGGRRGEGKILNVP